MIMLRRNTQRRHVKEADSETWSTDDTWDRKGSFRNEYGVLVSIDEVLLAPGGITTPRSGDEMEIVTYLLMGTLAHEDSTGDSGMMQAGEFQCMSTGRAIRHRETNPSQKNWSHLFQIVVRPAEAGLPSARMQKRFAAANRRNTLCVIASPDGRKESLGIHQDAVIYSSVLDSGHHLIHELLPWRSAWLHVVAGEVTLSDIVLTPGDGVGVTIEPAVSFTARERTEILLVDIGPVSRSRGRSVLP